MLDLSEFFLVNNFSNNTKWGWNFQIWGGFKAKIASLSYNFLCRKFVDFCRKLNCNFLQPATPDLAALAVQYDDKILASVMLVRNRLN